MNPAPRIAFALCILGTVTVQPSFARRQGPPHDPRSYDTVEVEPKLVRVPRSQVYYAPLVDTWDLYRLEDHWYALSEGDWYRAKGYRGPFRFVDPRQVPRVLVELPSEYRRRSSPKPRQPHQPHQPHQPLKQQRDWGGYDPRD